MSQNEIVISGSSINIDTGRPEIVISVVRGPAGSQGPPGEPVMTVNIKLPCVEPTIEEEVNAMTPEVYVESNAMIIFHHCQEAYIYSGPANVTLGAAGDYITSANDFTASGVADHDLLGNRSLADQHPASAITGVQEHIDDVTNPHLVTYEQLGGVQPAPQPHAHTENDITDLDKYTQAEVNASQAAQDTNINDNAADFVAHESNMSNPHGVTAAQTGAAPEGHTHPHIALSGIGPNDHHSQAHDHSKAEDGVVPHSVLTLDTPNPHGKMNWKSTWTSIIYEQHDVIRAGSWTMIANKQTTEYPYPTPVTDFDWAVFGDTIPAWESQTTSTTRLLTGIKITTENVVSIGSFQVWIPFIDPDVAYFLVLIEEDQIPKYEQLFPLVTGWLPVTFSAEYFNIGTDIELYLVTQGQGTNSTSFTYNFTYRLSTANPNPDNPPTLGQFRHFNANAPDIAYINKTDADGFSRKGDLDTLQAGDTIAWTDSGGVDVFFTLTADPVYYNSAVGDEDFYELNISPAIGQGNNGTVGMTFVHFLDRPTEYVRIADRFVDTPTARGLLSTTGTLDGVIETTDAYGIDILYQEIAFPEDWDIVSDGTGTGGGGTGGGGDLTDAPSDGTLYARKDALWQHIIEGDINDLDKYSQYEVDQLLALYSLLEHHHTLGDIEDSGTMAYVDDAPQDGRPYVRQDGNWRLATGGTWIGMTPPEDPKLYPFWWDSREGHGEIKIWFEDVDSGQWVITSYGNCTPPPAAVESATYETADGKTVTVVNGLIVGIE